jgi:hypothetical protein
VVYLCSTPYAPENEHGVHSLDPPPFRASEPVGRAREPDGRGIGDASPYVRTVKTSSGATAVQIVYSSHRGSREIEHLGAAHSGAEVELLKAAAQQRLAAGQGELDLGLSAAAPGGPLPVTSSRMGHLRSSPTVNSGQ